MTVQTVSRQTILNRFTEIIRNLPDDRLQQAWEQINLWPSTFSKLSDDGASFDQVDKEVFDFVIPPSVSIKNRFVRLPVRVQGAMAQVEMEVGEPNVDGLNSMMILQSNVEWWNTNYNKIVEDPSLHHRYVAISNGEVFSGDSYLEAYHKTNEAHDDGFPYIFFLNSPSREIDHAN